jgi:hypothetical protein
VIERLRILSRLAISQKSTRQRNSRNAVSPALGPSQITCKINSDLMLRFMQFGIFQVAGRRGK